MSDEKLPERYVPSSLRRPKPKVCEVQFACGYLEHGEGRSYGMFAGPFPTLEEALESVPEEGKKKAFLIRFNGDGTEDLLYAWSLTGSCWKRWRPR